MFNTMRRMLAAAVLFAQPFALGGSSSTTMPVSPSVLATVMSVMGGQGKGELELMVLWRGSPAWFWRADGQAGGGGGGSTMSGGSMGAAGRGEMRTEFISQGGVNLNLRSRAGVPPALDPRSGSHPERRERRARRWRRLDERAARDRSGPD